MECGLRTAQDLETFGLRKRHAARVDGFNINVTSKVPVIERENALDAMNPHRRHKVRAGGPGVRRENVLGVLR